MSDYGEALMAALAPGSWMQLQKAYLYAMKKDEAVVLTFLLDFYYNLDKAYTLEGGWFFCTVETLQQDAFVEPKAQTRILQALEDLGVLATCRRGMPSRRYIRLIPEGLNKLLIDYKQYMKHTKDTKSGAASDTKKGVTSDV
jgi:hypothetical protein